jgi:hypothetical protein
VREAGASVLSKETITKEVYMLINLLRDKQEIEKLIFTLEICIKSLPEDAHPAHQQRLEELISDLKRQCK